MKTTNKTFDEQMVYHLLMYVNNLRDVYCMTEWLINCVTKRLRKGSDVSESVLVGCSSMTKLINLAARHAIHDDGVIITIAEKKEAKARHARYIIECANYLATA